MSGLVAPIIGAARYSGPWRFDLARYSFRVRRLAVAPPSPKPRSTQQEDPEHVQNQAYRRGSAHEQGRRPWRRRSIPPGQVADKAKGGSVKEQTQEILGLIEAILAEAGTDKAQILSATIYLSDISAFAEMNAVWDEWVDKANPPARATVEAKLVAPEYKVEIAVSRRSERQQRIGSSEWLSLSLFAVQGIVRVPAIADRLKAHGARVDEQQAADEPYAEADDLPHDFERHHRADDAGQRAEHAGLLAGRRRARRRRAGKRQR